MVTKKRIIGIDLLKFVSMLGIIGLHIINKGGVLYFLSPNSYKHYIVLLVLTFLYSSVNIFAIISGYLYVNQKKPKNKNIINLILIMLFYSIGISLVFYLFNFYDVRSQGFRSLIMNTFPFLSGRYWYIISYIFVFFMIPFLNLIISKINKKQFKKLLIVLFILLSIIPTLFLNIDLFKTSYGYSPFWLIYLYLIGAYIKLYLDDYKDNKKLLLISFSSIILAFVLNSIIRCGSYNLLGEMKKSDWFINYISPFITIFSIAIVIIFKNIKINNKNLQNAIIKISSYSFAVYIIHSHMLIFDYVIDKAFLGILDLNIFSILLVILLSLLGIYLICTVIDYIRIKLFNVLRINKISEYFGNKLDKVLELDEE